MNIFKIVMIGIALIGYSPSMALIRNCFDKVLKWSCSFRMMNHDSILHNLDLNDESQMKQFERSCIAVGLCSRFVGHCEGFNDERTKKTFTIYKTCCKTFNYLANDFAACKEKIENTPCFKNLAPFLSGEDLKDKKKVEERCKNFFGKDQCLKKEILEHCSVKEWEGFRDHVIALNNDVMKQCDFKNVV